MQGPEFLLECLPKRLLSRHYLRPTEPQARIKRSCVYKAAIGFKLNLLQRVRACMIKGDLHQGMPGTSASILRQDQNEIEKRHTARSVGDCNRRRAFVPYQSNPDAVECTLVGGMHDLLGDAVLKASAETELRGVDISMRSNDPFVVALLRCSHP